MKVLLHLLLLFIISNIYAQHFSGNKIGKINNNEIYTIIVDTLSLKQDLAAIVSGKPDTLSLDKIEIKKGKTIGQKAEDFYMLVAYDHAKKLKVARWLIKKGNNLYYSKVPTVENFTDELLFFNTILLCYNSDQDCFPQVVHVDGVKVWSPSTTLECSAKEKSCNWLKILIYNE